MFCTKKISFLAVLALGFLMTGSLAKAGIRDAGSKIRGDVTLFDAPTTVTAYSYARPAISQAPTVARTYSVVPRNQAPSGSGGIAQQPSSAARRYSYEPSAPVVSQPSVSNRSVELRGPAYLRADSKVLGHSGH